MILSQGMAVGERPPQFCTQASSGLPCLPLLTPRQPVFAAGVGSGEQGEATVPFGSLAQLSHTVLALPRYLTGHPGHNPTHFVRELTRT